MDKSIGAGMMIGLGAILKLRIGGHLGNLCFAIGLLTIVVFQMNLYTGKAGLFFKREIKAFELLEIFYGNFVGAYFMGLMGFLDPEISESGSRLIESQMKNLGLTFCLSIGCGILMYIATQVYKKDKQWGLIALIGCVFAFLEAGFAHSIADMAYISLGNCLSPQTLGLLLVVAIGNFIGANWISIFS